MILKTFRAPNYPLDTTISASFIIPAIHYAINNGANIINASWSGIGESQALKDVIEAAGEAGILFVTGAGNNNRNSDVDTQSYPASYDLDNIIAVTATDSSDNKAVTSNYGQISVDLGAPGVDIHSTLPNNSYGLKSGTSMAAAHVTGAAAVLLSENENRTPSNIKNLLLSTVDPIDSMSNITSSGGRLNLFNAFSCKPNKLFITNEKPNIGFIATIALQPVIIQIDISACGDYIENTNVSVAFNHGENTLLLFDDGQALDGRFANTWYPQTAGPVELTFTAQHIITSNKISAW